MKLKLILLTLALMALGTVGANAQTGLCNAMKKGTETKTKNDAEGAKMPAYKGVKHAPGVTDFTNESGPASSTELGTKLRVMLERGNPRLGDRRAGFPAEWTGGKVKDGR
jgi:hypothetical protein